MHKIRDFQCKFDHVPKNWAAVAARSALPFPELHLHHESMVTLALALRQQSHSRVCTLPFCHTVEAEALGGHINYGDAAAGPRAKEYICTSAEELLELPEIDLSSGRIHEVLLACRTLHDRGEAVALEISGPLTILNALIDLRHVFKAMRKNRPLMQEIYRKLGQSLLPYVQAAKDAGVSFLSYADSSAGVNILGPRLLGEMLEDFTFDFLRQTAEITAGSPMLLLCPKTTYALVDSGYAVLRPVPLPAPMGYEDACLAMRGRIAIAGQMCIKNKDYLLQNGSILELLLQDPQASFTPERKEP